MKKKLIALMLAGAITATPFGLVACTDEEEIVNKPFEDLTAKNLVVACTQRGKTVLHKAKVYTEYEYGSHSSHFVDKRYEFNCNLPNTGGILVSYPDGVPDEEFGLFDELCDICFAD